MPTLSIIKAGNKYAYTYTGEEDEITRMLTQCALRDELLAEAITQSARNISREHTAVSDLQNSKHNPEI